MSTPDINQRRPAITYASHPNQRYFDSEASTQCQTRDWPVEVRLIRMSDVNVARLQIDLSGVGGMIAELSPAGLRRLACNLLDAAADIEQHPAATLTVTGKPA